MCTSLTEGNERKLASMRDKLISTAIPLISTIPGNIDQGASKYGDQEGKQGQSFAQTLESRLAVQLPGSTRTNSVSNAKVVHEGIEIQPRSATSKTVVADKEEAEGKPGAIPTTKTVIDDLSQTNDGSAPKVQVGSSTTPNTEQEQEPAEPAVHVAQRINTGVETIGSQVQSQPLLPASTSSNGAKEADGEHGGNRKTSSSLSAQHHTSRDGGSTQGSGSLSAIPVEPGASSVSSISEPVSQKQIIVNANEPSDLVATRNAVIKESLPLLGAGPQVIQRSVDGASSKAAIPTTGQVNAEPASAGATVKPGDAVISSSTNEASSAVAVDHVASSHSVPMHDAVLSFADTQVAISSQVIPPILEGKVAAAQSVIPSTTAGSTVGQSDSHLEVGGGPSYQSPHILTASPTTLEVGVQTETHGWLKVRAEISDGGAVNASVSASSTSGQEMLRHELPSISNFLAKENVSVALVVVHGTADTQTALQAGTEAPDQRQQAANGDQRQRGQGAEQPNQDEAHGTGSHLGGADDDVAVPSTGFPYTTAGNWLSVRA